MIRRLFAVHAILMLLLYLQEKTGKNVIIMV